MMRMVTARRLAACLLLLPLLLPDSAMATKNSAKAGDLSYSLPSKNATSSAKAATLPAPAANRTAPAECWQPLLTRLKADGLDGPDLHGHFARLGDGHSPVPMSTKVTELFTTKYLRSQQPKKPSTGPARRVYPNIITQTNLDKCREFLKTNKTAFDKAETTYKVPREVIVSLLFVETRLGGYLGSENAFRSLASMAASTTPDHVSETIATLPMTPDRMEWVKEILVKRSDWAYTELKALIVHARENNLDPLTMPGSVYGAVGLCQFMPSNFKKFAVDGNGDGKVDLFEPADAIMSVGNYLSKHGWNTQKARDARQAVLKRYNNSTVYANTILTMSESFTAKPQAVASTKPATTTSAKKSTAKAKPAAKQAAKPAAKTPAKTAAAKPAKASSDTSAPAKATQTTSQLGPRIVLP